MKGGCSSKIVDGGLGKVFVYIQKGIRVCWEGE